MDKAFLFYVPPSRQWSRPAQFVKQNSGNLLLKAGIPSCLSSSFPQKPWRFSCFNAPVSSLKAVRANNWLSFKFNYKLKLNRQQTKEAGWYTCCNEILKSQLVSVCYATDHFLSCSIQLFSVDHPLLFEWKLNKIMCRIRPFRPVVSLSVYIFCFRSESAGFKLVPTAMIILMRAAELLFIVMPSDVILLHEIWDFSIWNSCHYFVIFDTSLKLAVLSKGFCPNIFNLTVCAGGKHPILTLCPNSDHHLTSPYHVTSLFVIQGMRIQEMITGDQLS